MLTPFFRSNSNKTHQAMAPDLLPNETTLPNGSKDVGDGYVLLRVRDRASQRINGAEGEAIINFYAKTEGRDPGNLRVTRWARLRLPNRQIARSAWKESGMAEPRISCMVKLEVCSFRNVTWSTACLYLLSD